MASNYYGPLREAHQAVDAATNSNEPASPPAQHTSIAKETAVERPQPSPRWTAEGGMVQNETSALAWAKLAQQHQQARFEAQQSAESGKEATQAETAPRFQTYREQAGAMQPAAAPEQSLENNQENNIEIS